MAELHRRTKSQDPQQKASGTIFQTSRSRRLKDGIGLSRPFPEIASRRKRARKRRSKKRRVRFEMANKEKKKRVRLAKRRTEEEEMSST